MMSRKMTLDCAVRRAVRQLRDEVKHLVLE